ncbi:MAG: prolyl oligopeptidase family serine peptidase [Clostridia bacterium]|nr:prolyl oligopeptidase family serine peptidase [Clostridia bacterium]
MECKPQQIAILGFSAVGHLAASISTLWNNPQIFTEEEIEEGLHKPDATILSYPVITSGEFREPGSFAALLGEDASDELMERLSLKKQVNEKTALAFLWHTYEDNGVPVENTLLYAQALSKYKIPSEAHIYPHGAHGLSLVSDPTIWAVPKFRRKFDWLGQSVEWLIDIFEIRPFE